MVKNSKKNIVCIVTKRLSASQTRGKRSLGTQTQDFSNGWLLAARHSVFLVQLLQFDTEHLGNAPHGIAFFDAIVGVAEWCFVFLIPQIYLGIGRDFLGGAVKVVIFFKFFPRNAAIVGDNLSGCSLLAKSESIHAIVLETTGLGNSRLTAHRLGSSG